MNYRRIAENFAVPFDEEQEYKRLAQITLSLGITLPELNPTNDIWYT